MKRFFRVLLFFIISVLFLFVLSGYFINYKFQKKCESYNSIPIPEIWSHRGIISDTLKENTIEAFKEVMKHGVTGIEIDVFWIDSLKKCIVMHDLDSHFNSNSVLYLEDIFNRFKDTTNYWIDFKNLNDNNAVEVQKYLSNRIQTSSITGKVYVESGDVNALNTIDNEYIQTLYWIQFNRDNWLKKQLKLLYIKYKILSSSFEGYTIAYSFMDNEFKKHFKGLPIYLFHANSIQIISEQKINKNVKVYLADKDYLLSNEK